ncbi:hypothetical protein Rvan_3145 [Rhodomicrobium vannielii ATCC 17100]|uniref:Uncharacterized protein n=2 Tax=Rhodomicrobium vannielii TaxID=1069 RepID=E3I124_RHOVT|nr:hypothetical protein Rvan_3145 [Rhodomicrobium vannielii ATCC 17100]
MARALHALTDQERGSASTITQEAPARAITHERRDDAEPKAEGDFATLVEDLPAMALRERFRAEANSHRNMLDRAKSHGRVINPAFRDFRSFLRHVGPMPAPGYTLDRIDNEDPEYAPGKVRWADKQTQNTNKGDSLTFADEKGRTFTTSELAGKQGIDPSTIRQRAARGWTDMEIIAGKKQDAVNDNTNSDDAYRSERRANQAVIRAEKKRADAIQVAKIDENRIRHDTDDLPAPPTYFLEEFPDMIAAPFEVMFKGYCKAAKEGWWPKYRRYMTPERFAIQHPDFHKMIAEVDPDFAAKMHDASKAKEAHIAEL